MTIAGMPRTARGSQGGYCYHVLNRGNLRAEVFHGEGDFHAFVRLIGQASRRGIPDWLAALPSEQSLLDATRVVFNLQRQAGIDLPTDGELYRFDVNHPDEALPKGCSKRGRRGYRWCAK